MGVEFTGSAIIYSWMKASGNFSLSRNRILDFTEYVDDYDNGGQQTFSYSSTDISFSPNLVGAANLSFMPAKNIEFSLLSKYVGKQYLDNTQNENRKLDPFYVQDARFIYSFQKGWLKEANIILQANNVFNKMYEPNGYTFSYIYGGELLTENYYYPMAGRNFIIGVNLRF